MSQASGERMASEPGQSVEFHDFRPYQAGDELRYVDWRVYARTGRLYTRLFQAERSIRLHIVLDTSASMTLWAKARYARVLAKLLSYTAQRDAPTQLHLLDGRSNRPAQGLAGVGAGWRFLDEAPTLPGVAVAPLTALKRFALGLPARRGAALVLVISDLLEDAPLRPTLVALRARGVDASIIQVLGEDEFDPVPGQLELVDVESGERLQAGPAEVLRYREEVRAFVRRTRAAVLQAGFRHVLVQVPRDMPEHGVERDALGALVRAGVLVRR